MSSISKTKKTLCACGKPKDYRVKRCLSCSNKATAKDQWANEKSRQRIADGLKKAGLDRRRRFGDLNLSSFTMTKQDGRKYAHYWGEDEKRHYIYRYQWVWINANGPIPTGMTVHHKNEDSTDDRLENLELLSNEAHSLLHMTEAHKRKMVEARGMKYHGLLTFTCSTCGTSFTSHLARPRKYCSLSCRNEGYRKPKV